MILTKTIIPKELLWAISSGWETDCFSSLLNLKPGTGAELWLSTKPFHVQNGNNTTFSNMQLLTPREGAFIISPNDEKLLVLRIRHSKLYMLSRGQTNATVDKPVDLHALWSNNLLKYLPRYFELGCEVLRGFNLLLKMLPVEKYELNNNLIEYVYTNHTTKVCDVALEFKYSQRYIQKRFLEAHGITIKKYQLICRLETAIKETIQNGDMYGAILNAGFYDQSHFIKSFKIIYLSTPTSFLSDPVNDYFYNRTGPTYLKI
ncbi:helix-turn-helix domain-containing protein [Scandinavium sp. TWS1a]|uniref:helix-turn-helix domain-containing protein n=1 Tax=Scandinavium tedordense TaxID=2926521 RepID=UPI00216682C4|nr:helix-turn-helix domain-containing protein [Scandinavium tedordense]MCS2169587.1 helix-turn-helix domain-containing protein [Scandinavium tedordense]